MTIARRLAEELRGEADIEVVDFLARGGRLNRAAMLIGTVTGLKPIISLTEQGMLSLVGRAHGWERAIRHILQWVADRITYPEEHWLGVVHSRLPGEAEQLAETLQKLYNPREIVIAEIGPSIGTHVGPGALGVAFHSEKGRA